MSIYDMYPEEWSGDVTNGDGDHQYAGGLGFATHQRRPERDVYRVPERASRPESEAVHLGQQAVAAAFNERA